MNVATLDGVPRSVHLFPKADGWIVVSGDRADSGQHFSDLGRALDAATRGGHPVHVVVHERATHDTPGTV